ncbi:MAG: FadR family transcriptional regulator [Betaproteobacteria bacterium]|nr:FadR family transcriptional regulator [Betaproteobacteria bacterium]
MAPPPVSAAVLRSPSLAADIGALLEARIQQGLYAPGSRLPTEMGLAEEFGVSRAVVREAVARLKADGLVESRQGSGMTVAARLGLASFKVVAGSREGDDLTHIFELRALVETGAAELAARRRTPADLAALYAALQGMAEAARLGADGAEDDDAFHQAIAAATHNPQVQRFIAYLSAQFSQSRRPTWDAEGHASGRAALAQAEHERIYAAIAAGDIQGARAAAANHLYLAATRVGAAPEAPAA